MALLVITLHSYSASAQCPESENNNNPASADSISLACPASGAMNQSDGNDFYLFNLEQDGLCTLKTQKSGTGEIVIRILDAELGGNPEVKSLFVGTAVNQHELVLGLLAGKYFIRVEWWNGSCQYTIGLSVTPTPWGQDPEPNNIFALAAGISPDTLVQGSLGYYDPGIGEDLQDWYRMELKETGFFKLFIEKAQPGEIQIGLFEKPENTSISITGTYLTTGEPLDSLVRPLRKGIYYLQLSRWNTYSEYRLTTHFNPAPFPDDTEHNNQPEQATDMVLDTSLTGTIGFYSPGSNLDFDNQDWYRILVTKPGLLKLILEKDRGGEYLVRIYGGNGLDQLKDGLVSQNEALDSLTHLFRDTGQYYVTILQWTGYSVYRLNSSYLLYPEADFDFVQVDNKIAFQQKSIYAANYHWDFGDSMGTVASEPIHIYRDPGVFRVCLEAENAAARDTVCRNITVKGIAAVYPRSAGNTGDLTLSVFGGGMDEESIIRLRRGGQLIAEQRITRRFALDGISGTLDLRGKGLGFCDVEVENGDGGIFSLKDALEIVPGTFPDPWAEVSGRSRILFNTPTTYKIRFGNNGNVDATMVPVWIAISEVPGLEVKFTGAQFIELNEGGDSLTADLSDTDEYFIMDTVLSMPFKARVYPFIIPVVGANSVAELNIRVKAGGAIRINAWTNMPFFQSPLDTNVKNCLIRITRDIAFPLLVDLPNASIQNCLLNSLSTGIERIVNLYNNAGFVGQLTAPGLIRRELQFSPQRLIKFTRIFWSVVKNCAINSGYTESEINSLRRDFSERITRSLVNLFLLPPETIINCLKGNCPKTNAFRSNPGECRECATFCAINERQTRVQAVSSFDPNEKEGPSGFLGPNYHGFQKSIPFTIHFENLATASAPAHKVMVIDTLDKNVFDLSSFQFGSFQIADSIYQPDKGQYRFFADVPMNHLNVVARVEALLDTSSGRLEWVFNSLQPGRLEPVEDPDIGFLPANKIKPEGQGSVSFTLDLKEDLPHGTVIQNKALIFFDANAPIETNKYRMTLDLLSPESKVQPLNPMPSGNKMEVKWSGTDQGSGIAYYDVFISDNDSLYRRWKIRTTAVSDTFTGEIGHRYKFYSVAVDHTGNAETSPGTADASTAITTSAGDVQLEKGWQIYPNPAVDWIRANSPTPAPYWISIDNLQGQTLFQKTIQGFRTEIGLNRLDPGFYMVRVMNAENQLVHRSKLVVLDPGR